MSIAAKSERSNADRSANATSKAAALNASPAHENHRVLRPLSRSTTGARKRTPPRMSSITKTMETPSNVYANVVVVRIIALHRPESAVHREGTGHERPSHVRCDADRHQPVPSRNTPTTTSEATL